MRDGDYDGTDYGDPYPRTAFADGYAEDDDGPDPHEYGELDDLDFADPGGVSALRAASPTNPRNLPCPSCGEPNRLTPADRARGYICDHCADRAEGTYFGADY